MQTKRELRSEIEVLAEKVGTPVSTERMNQTQLTALRDELKAKAESLPGDEPGLPEVPFMTGAVRAPKEPTAEEALGEEGDATAEPPTDTGSSSGEDEGEPPSQGGEPGDQSSTPALATPAGAGGGRYEVAERKIVLTLRGKKGAFQQVKPSDFPGGQKDLDELVGNGTVLRK